AGAEQAPRLARLDLAGAGEPDGHPLDGSLGQVGQPRAKRTIVLVSVQLAKNPVGQVVLRSLGAGDRQGPGGHVQVPAEDQLAQQCPGKAQAGSPGVQSQLSVPDIVDDEKELVCQLHPGHTPICRAPKACTTAIASGGRSPRCWQTGCGSRGAAIRFTRGSLPTGKVEDNVTDR